VPRKDVMTVIADFAAYPEWASAVRSAEVLSQDPGGRASAVRFQLDAGPIKDVYILSYEWFSDDRGVSWDLVKGQMQRAQKGSYVLQPRDGDRTEVTYELAVGIRIPMIGMVKRRAEKMIIDTALKGLKSRAESIGSTR